MLWIAELHHDLVCHSIRPFVAYSTGACGEGLAGVCKMLLRSFVRVMRKDFLKHKHKHESSYYYSKYLAFIVVCYT